VGKNLDYQVKFRKRYKRLYGGGKRKNQREDGRRAMSARWGKKSVARVFVEREKMPGYA